MKASTNEPTTGSGALPQKPAPHRQNQDRVVRVVANIHGIDDKVSFRSCVVHAARVHHVVGEIEDMAGGTVRIICEGTRTGIDKLFDAARDEEFGIPEVDWDKVESEEPTGEFEDFVVVRGDHLAEISEALDECALGLRRVIRFQIVLTKGMTGMGEGMASLAEGMEAMGKCMARIEDAQQGMAENISSWAKGQDKMAEGMADWADSHGVFVGSVGEYAESMSSWVQSMTESQKSIVEKMDRIIEELYLQRCVAGRVPGDQIRNFGNLAVTQWDPPRIGLLNEEHRNNF